MSTTTLVQAVKEFKDKQAKATLPSDMVLQTVSWDLDTAFVGQRVTASTVSRLSEYVDRKLEEYSAIHGSMPAVRNIPQAVASFPNVPSPDNDRTIGCVMCISPPACDDHVGHGRRMDQFMRINVTEDEACSADVVVDPEEVSQESGDNPDEAMRKCVDLAREDGVPAGAIYSDGQVDYPDDGSDEEVARPWEDVLGLSIKRLQDTTTEGFKLTTQDTQVPEEVNLYHPLPEKSVVGRVLDDSAQKQSWLHGHGDLDTLVYSRGMLPGVPDRVRDSFLRQPPEIEAALSPGILRTQDMREVSNSILRAQAGREVINDPQRPTKIKPLHVGMNPTRTPWPWPRNRALDTTSYVTSYDIDHVTLKITARVVTAPSSMKIDQNVWFDLCSEPRDLKEVIRTTMKANLAILVKPGRNDGWRRDGGETEAVALDTLREMITEEEFRRYIKYGFVAVRGRSGNVYQIFRNKHHTKVWKGNKVVEEVCVRIRYEARVPPTDNVIAFMAMVQADEDAFRKAGNVYKMVGSA